MKKFLYLIVMLFITVPIFSQDEDDEEIEQIVLDNLPIGIGPYIGCGVGTNMTPAPDGRQTDIVFYRLPDAGVSIYLPLTPRAYIGLSSDIGFSNYGYIVEDFSTEDEYIHHFACFTFNPSLVFRGFSFGYTLGIPLLADYNDSKIKLSDLNIQHGISFGYLYPIWGDNDGRISVSFELTYMFTNVFEDYGKDDPLKKIIPETDIPLNNSNSPRFVSAIIGFNYTFNLFNKAIEEADFDE